jgi:hypothetical protein
MHIERSSGSRFERTPKISPQAHDRVQFVSFVKERVKRGLHTESFHFRCIQTCCLHIARRLSSKAVDTTLVLSLSLIQSLTSNVSLRNSANRPK